MTYIKILLPCFFISCSCSNNSHDVLPTFEGSLIEEQVSFIDSSAIRVDSSISQVVLDAKIDSFADKGTEKRLYNTSKPLIKKPAVSTVKKNKAPSLNSGCFDYSTSPLTIDDAMNCSMYHWNVAREFLRRGEVDSSLQHCQRAIALYENGSLFYLKAKLLNLQKHPSSALQAAEISLTRNDHWSIQDRQKSTQERCAALWALYHKYPSSELLQKILNSCQEY